jgi:hypothetical protein
MHVPVYVFICFLYYLCNLFLFHTPTVFSNNIANLHGRETRQKIHLFEIQNLQEVTVSYFIIHLVGHSFAFALKFSSNDENHFSSSVCPLAGSIDNS